MKISTKPRVSWPSGPNLCQVKIFQTEDCPAKVASQPQRHSYTNQSSSKPQGPDLPPGFEGNHYVVKPKVSIIPCIKWKRPLKFSVNDNWLVGDGGESTERRTENLRIPKVLEAIYPHYSAIPSRPSVSPVVEAECFDDIKTPTIRLTPIEDELESTEDSSHITVQSGFTRNKPPCPTQERVSSGLPPDLSLAALTALMKTKEQGNKIDTELLIKLLSDPKAIKNMITDTSGKSSETKNQPFDTNFSSNRVVQQRIVASPMASKPQPVILPQEHNGSTSRSFTNPERPVSPPKPRNGNISPPKAIDRNPSNLPIHLHSQVGIPKEQPLLARFPSSSPPMNLNLQGPQPKYQPNPAFNNSEMNNVQASIGLERGPETGFDSYPMNLNPVTSIGGPKPAVQPMKSVDYFKNLIREHGTDNNETKQYRSQIGIYNGRIDNDNKIQKRCRYFGTASGCKLGDSCIYVHDRFRPNFETDAPRNKRLKFVSHHSHKRIHYVKIVWLQARSTLH